MADALTNEPESPAFPEHRLRKDTWGGYEIKSAPGLTKRELFAAMAMQGLLANATLNQAREPIADLSVTHADALLTALDQTHASK